ncbi:hypothetical protein [Moorena sp. SIO4G3]|uniref:hypothetical protein n=1 Tax=Moorena sp. SIO4G3 TaxID=2607821 RepID=UPI00142CAF53|nr:hypothetical protein [Moorena sp. SIO4G3]NEO77800.1 hypothetical protein [Moorena sp. SIO4G3]
MSETPITITYSLEEVLKDINGKLDSLQKDVNKINETLIKVKTKPYAIDRSRSVGQSPCMSRYANATELRIKPQRLFTNL